MRRPSTMIGSESAHNITILQSNRVHTGELTGERDSDKPGDTEASRARATAVYHLGQQRIILES